MISIQTHIISYDANSYLKDEVEPTQIPQTLINLSSDVIQIPKHEVLRILCLYADNQGPGKFEIYHLSMESSGTNLLCTP